MTAVAEDVRAEGNRGIEAVQRRQPDQASVHFSRALELAEGLGDERERRDEIATLAGLFQQMGFPDLALLAAESAIDLDRGLGLVKACGEDLLTAGNAHTQMDNELKAEAAYREALALFLKHDHWADAASATTNLAGIVANRGEFAEAVVMFEASLAYLAQESFDETERNTRFALLQVIEHAGGSVDLALDNARQLCTRFWPELSPQHRDVARDFVGRALERYAQGHPEAKAPKWRKKHFPMLDE